MAENLMKWLPCLDKKDCAEIVYALEHFGLEKYRKNPLPYGDITSLALVNREDAIAALRKVYMRYGTAAAAAATLAAVRKLESPCVHQSS
jgi:hypothetical protein